MKIFVATPFHGYSATAAWIRAIDELKMACAGVHDLYVKPLFGISDLIWARNMHTHLFLKTEYDRIITFDGDQYAPPQNFLALVASPHHLSACPVPKKRDDLAPAEAFNFVCEQGAPVIRDGFMRVDLVGAGMMCVTRDLVLRMCYEQRYYMFMREPIPDLYARAYTEESMIHPEQLSEDYTFCRRALPEKPWIYVDAKVQHMGDKMWTGDLHV